MRLEATFPPAPPSIAEARRFVRQVVSEEAVPAEDIQAVVLAVSEAVTNALVHSNSSKILVSCSVSDDAVEATVKDEGIFEWDAPGPARGLRAGLALAGSVLDELAIHPGTPARPGTVVRLVKHRRREPDGARVRKVQALSTTPQWGANLGMEIWS